MLRRRQFKDATEMINTCIHVFYFNERLYFIIRLCFADRQRSVLNLFGLNCLRITGTYMYIEVACRLTLHKYMVLVWSGLVWFKPISWCNNSCSSRGCITAGICDDLISFLFSLSCAVVLIVLLLLILLLFECRLFVSVTMGLRFDF